MTLTLNPNRHLYQSGCRHAARRGIGLLEVIVCTALVAVMIVPLAGVIRASGQAISQSDGITTTEAKLRRALRWLSVTIENGEVDSVQTNRIRIRMPSGDMATVRVVGSNLELREDSSRITLAEDVQRIRFRERRQASAPNARIGVEMTLRARDPASGRWVTITSAAAIPPQL